MGPKKKPGKVPPVKVVEPPFSFHVNNFPTNTGLCSICLFTNIEVHFKEIELEVKVRRHPITRAPVFDLIIVKNKEEPRPHNQYMGEELLPFTVFNIETKQKLEVDPMRTMAQQPFIGVNPDNGAETVFGPPYFIHYDVETRKRYLLDLRKVGAGGGKLKFKDPESGEEVVVDITKRVDPLSGLPLFGNYQNPDRVFIATIKDGEMYIDKDPITDDVEIINYNGQPVLEYRTVYDTETDKTTILDENGEAVMSLDGNHQIQLNLPEETLKEARRNIKRKEKEGRRTLFGTDETGELDDNESSDSESSWDLESMEYAEDGEMFDENEDLLTDGKPKQRLDKDGNVIDVYDFDKERQRDIEEQSLGLHIQFDMKTGNVTIVDEDGNNVDLPSGSRFETDPVNGNIRLVNKNGEPIDLKTVFKQWTDLSKPSDMVEQGITRKPILFGGEHPERKKTEEEIYLESLKSEDALLILEGMKEMDCALKCELMKSLFEAIDYQRQMIDRALQVKIEEERKFILNVIKEKKIRQNQFILDLLHRNVNNYDRHEVEKEIFHKLDRENEYLFDKLEDKISHENNLVSQALQKDFVKYCEPLDRKNNTNCYKRCKRILVKELRLKLEAEINNLKQELCNDLMRERNEIQNIVETFYTNV